MKEFITYPEGAQYIDTKLHKFAKASNDEHIEYYNPDSVCHWQKSALTVDSLPVLVASGRYKKISTFSPNQMFVLMFVIFFFLTYLIVETL